MAGYTLVSGHIVEHEPTPEVEKFLTKIQGMVEDPKVSIDAVVAFAYSAANPLLDEYPYGGRGAITAKTLANPSYKVLTDLVFRKQHTPEQIQALADKHTLTVSRAAEKLGVHESAVRQSIAAGRLASWIKNGRHYLDPAAVDQYETTARGPKSLMPRKSNSQLEAYFGSANGVAFRVFHPGDWISQVKRGHGIRASTSDWSQIGIFTATGGDARFVVIEPSEKEEEYSVLDFYVKGKFRIVERVNNSKEAENCVKAWKQKIYMYQKAKIAAQHYYETEQGGSGWDFLTDIGCIALYSDNTVETYFESLEKWIRSQKLEIVAKAEASNPDLSRCTKVILVYGKEEVGKLILEHWKLICKVQDLIKKINEYLEGERNTYT